MERNWKTLEWWNWLFLPNVKSLAAAPLSGTYFSFFCSERVVTIDILVARFAPFFSSAPCPIIIRDRGFKGATYAMPSPMKESLLYSSMGV